MLRLLINSLSRAFYQQHAGYFLMGFYVLFGVVEPSQLLNYHSALLMTALSSPAGLAMVSVSWFLYSVKAFFFIKQKLAQPQYNFVKELGTLDKHPQLQLWLAFYPVILLPIIIYVFALSGLCLYNHLYISLICILAVFAALLTGLSLLSYRSVTWGFSKEESCQTNSYKNVKRPFFSWPLFYLLHEQPLMLLMCKILSLIFFKAMRWMFADVGNDIRVLLLALLASVLCHAVLVFTLLKFEIAFLNFSKSLPISAYERLIGWLFVFAIILLPEWTVLSISSAYDLYSIINGVVFGLAGMFFLLMVLYFVKLNMDIYLRWLLFFFFISMWAILAHYYLLFSLLVLGSCALYYLRNFNSTHIKSEEP